MTYHPFRRSHGYDDPNCGECGKPIEHDDHQVPIEKGSEIDRLLKSRGVTLTVDKKQKAPT